MRYRLEITRVAQKGLAGLPSEVRARVAAAIEALSETPRRPGVEALHGGLHGLHKVRVGEYRAVIHIDDDAGVIAVLRVGHRANVYR